MTVRSIQPHESVGAQRGEVVVCIWIDGCHERFLETLRSVLAHTPDDVRVLICGDTEPDSHAWRPALDEAARSAHSVIHLSQEPSGGFSATVNAALGVADPADVALVSPDCLVADGWLDGLREAAYVDARVATAIALTNDGVLASAIAPDAREFDKAAAAVRAGSLGVRPRVSAARGPCIYVRRSALELVGDFDGASSPGSGEELDFSQRCLQGGLCHVVADDVLVGHDSTAASAADGKAESTGPLERSLGAARRALLGLSVVIDARILTGPMNGTKVHVLELIAAVARTERARVTAILPMDIGADVRRSLETLPGVAFMTIAPGTGSPPTIRADVVHRPFQISAPADLTFLAQLGERLVITHQDLISYHNPSYFPTSSAWQGYRDLTRRALGAVDRVLFFSEHVRADALAEDIVEPDRASVVQIGVDHTVSRADGEEPSRPRGAERLPDEAEMMLCLGADFRHKNRMFALRMLDELQRRHEWTGWLVMAGSRVAFGSSMPDEEQMLAQHRTAGRRPAQLGRGQRS